MSETASHRLFLLDGMALIYRAHFAFITNPMKAPSGMNVSALYGFLNTLLLLKETGKPTHIAVAFDTSEPTERHKLFPEYKAHREAMPEDLSAQIPHLFRFLEALRIPIIRTPGYEADDIIGTIAREAEKHEDYVTYMVTPDKDFGQLIDETTYMWKPGRKGSEYAVITLTELKEQWEIESPLQVIDILSLMGDASDNIPGIPGIGEKTAKQLVNQFGSLENLLDHTDELKGKRKEIVIANADKARLSKVLATINTSVPLSLKLDDLINQTPNENALLSLFNEFNFKTLPKRFLGISGEPKKKKVLPGDDLFDRIMPLTNGESISQPEPKEEVEVDLFNYQENTPPPQRHTLRDTRHSYSILRTEAEEQTLIEKLSTLEKWAFDTETTGLNPLSDELLGISFSTENGVAYYLPVTPEKDLSAWKPVFLSSSEKIGHNLKFDLRVLNSRGIECAGPYFDTMIAHALLAPGQKHGMDYLAEVHLNYETIKLEDIAAPLEKKILDMKGIPVDILAEYAAEDADITLRLEHILRYELEKNNLLALYKTIEGPLIPVLASMEQEGININLPKLADISIELDVYLKKLSEAITEQAGRTFNLNSPKQLGTLLFDELKLVEKPKKTKTGQYVTDEETLNSLVNRHPIIQNILDYRESNKLKSTYVDALPRAVDPVDHRIHTNFMQLVTATGRIASQDPNIQNIPIRSEAGKQIRSAFIPRSSDFSLFSADYSQIELRVMAALSGDPAMIRAFETGRDIHTETAALIHQLTPDEVTSDMRRAAKTVNFGIIYGISPFGLSQRLAIPRGQAAEIIDRYFQEFSHVKQFMDDTIEEARNNGFVTTLNGRRRNLPEITSKNANIRQAAERIAINTPIQGTAADMIKLAMIQIHEYLLQQRTQSKLILQIHDELVFDLHKDEFHLKDHIVKLMTDALILPHQVPILVESNTGNNWLLAH